jgi:putative tricarboxylic transport membrane protein
MQRAHQAAGLVFAAIGAYLAIQGVRLGLEGMTGPGAGLFPFLIGLALLAASLVWIVQVQLAGKQPLPADFFPPSDGVRRIGVAIVLLLAFAVALRLVGYDLTMFVFLLALMFHYDRKHIVAKLVVALAASFGVHYLFEHVLRTPLPYASLSVLRDLGF